MEDLLQILQEIGLNEKEAETYLTLIYLGSNPVSTIAKKSGQNRSSCYANIQKLIQKGFVHQIIKNNINYFTAVEIKQILDQLKVKHSSLESKILGIEEIIYKNKILKNLAQEKSKMAFFQSEAGIINIMEDTLSSKEVIRAYKSLDKTALILQKYFFEYNQRRIEKGIKILSICPANEQSYIYKKQDHKELHETRLAPKDYDFELDIFIYDNKIAIISLKEQFGILIENKDIAKAQKKIFDLIWKYTKKYDETISKIIQKQRKKKGKSN